MKDRQYWAADEDTSKVVSKLITLDSDGSTWNTSPVVQAAIRNFTAYYSTILKTGSWATSLGFTGKQGELVEMVVPQARSIIRQLVTLITKQKMAFQTLAESSEGDIVKDVRLGNALAEQIVDQERMDAKGDQLCEGAFICGQWYEGALWRENRGDIHMVHPESGRDVYTGGVEIFTASFFDVIYDFNIPQWDDVPCAKVRFARNRWDLIAENPDLEEEILSIPSIQSRRSTTQFNDKVMGLDDMVWEYHFFHRPTSAVPNGRIVVFSSDKAVFSDDVNKYGTIPFEVMRPEPIQTLGFGYPIFANLLPAQEMLDHSFSAIATNQSAYAVQNITAPRGAGINVQEIGGLNFISFTPMANVQGGGRPEALQLTESSPETFKFIDVLRSHMMEISNINSSLRGSPPPGVTSGVAIATLTTNAMEFLDSSAKAYHDTQQRVMMHALNAEMKFAKVDKSLTMYGKNNQAYSKKYNRDQLKNLKGVKVTVASPLMQTASGRLELADKLVQAGLIKSPQDYLLVLEGQPTRKLYETELSESDLIQSENDSLQDGQPVPILSTDDHPAHVRGHSALLNDPEVRRNGAYAKNILDHILEHRRLAEETDPVLMGMVRTGKMPEGGIQQQQPAAPQQTGPGQVMEALPENKPADPAEDLVNREGAA